MVDTQKTEFNYTHLTSRQAAIQLNLSPDTVNALARSRKLRGSKVGRQWRFKQRDVTLLKKHLASTPETWNLRENSLMHDKDGRNCNGCKHFYTTWDEAFAYDARGSR